MNEFEDIPQTDTSSDESEELLSSDSASDASSGEDSEEQQQVLDKLDDVIAAINELQQEQPEENEESETVEETATDYSQQLTDINTLISYQNLQLLILSVFVVLAIGILVGVHLLEWFRGKN